MDNSFVVTPMSQEFNLEPGKTYDGKIAVANPGDSTSDFAYKISVAPYSVLGEAYDADLTTMSNHSMIVDWIKIDEPIGIVKPNETKEIYFTITVPESAPAGGQYASILVTENAQMAASQGLEVNSVFEIASLVYAEVAGETVREGEILENRIPSFVMTVPVNVGALISNTGNVHQTATTVLEVRNLLTGEVILPTEQNSGRYAETIMPDTTRQTSYDIANLPVVGAVKITQVVYYNGISSVEVKDVVICPIWFIVLAITLIASVIVAIVVLVKKRRKKRAVV